MKGKGLLKRFLNLVTAHRSEVAKLKYRQSDSRACTLHVNASALTGVAQWVGHRPANRKAAQLDSQSGHMPGLQARSPVEGVQETTVRSFSPSLSSSLPL